MISRESSSVRELPVTSARCWSWSIQPLVTWIRILGVDIPDFSTENRRCYHRWFSFVYGILCFFVHLTCQFDVLYVLFRQRMETLRQTKEEFESAIDSWNLIFDYINYTINAVCGHLILLTIIRPRWIAMMEHFQEAQLYFNEEHYVRIRNVSLRSVVFVILIVKKRFNFK